MLKNEECIIAAIERPHGLYTRPRVNTGIQPRRYAMECHIDPYCGRVYLKMRLVIALLLWPSAIHEQPCELV